MLGGIEDGNNTTSVEGWGEGGPLVLFFVFLSTNFVKLVLSQCTNSSGASILLCTKIAQKRQESVNRDYLINVKFLQ